MLSLFGLLGVVHAATLATPVATGNSQNGAMFDLYASNTVQVTAMTAYATGAGTCSYEVYYSTSPVATAKSSSTYWSKVGTSSNVVVTVGGAVTINLSTAVTMAAGTTYAWYVTSSTSTCTIYYNTGTTLGAVWASNSDLTLYEGYGVSYSFNAAFSPRDWYGVVTYTVGTIWYKDADSDGYGDPSTSKFSVSQPVGYVSNSSDCNDASSKISPKAQEVCDANNTDEDCDGVADDADTSATGQSTWYPDLDGDGYGTGKSKSLCDQPTGYVADSTDCNDANATINPKAQEVCDASNTDEDCDGAADDLDRSVTGQSNYYKDGDGDGYGAGTATLYCDPPSGYVTDSTDCNDANASISPKAQEVCDANNTDEDCDGLADDKDTSATGQSTYYKDGDGDGYGSTTTGMYCDLPSGYATAAGDCDDGSRSVNPGAKEVCDNKDVDEDCDGVADDKDPSASGQSTFYKDNDGDGYGGTTTGAYCDLPSGYTNSATDCNDYSSLINPGAQEICDANNTDEDCDILADDKDPSATGQSTWYVDRDQDTYGSTVTTAACDQPSGYVAQSGDCDDSSSSINPGASEYCNSKDDNCNNSIDENTAVDALTWYADGDGDGYGNAAASTRACSQPANSVADATDCDDSQKYTHPKADEYCDGVDNDCNGTLDDDYAVDALSWYADTDGDGFGDVSIVDVACNAPSNYVSDAKDCDDSDAMVSPGAAELCNGIDDNCDGTADENTAADATTWYADGDGDGYGSSLTTVSCTAPSGYVSAGGDCDDSSGKISPAANERCNGVDDNCDGTVDESSAVNASTWYADDDGDGYGNANNSIMACNQPSGAVSDASDCDDRSHAVHPTATELCNGVDDNCDGTTDESTAADAATWYADGDQDGYGDDAKTAVQCDEPVGYVAVGGDCEDADAAYNPGVVESCGDPNDYNCDGSVGYTDGDGDGYAACEECDDANPTVHPGATETCNGLDDNCDGLTDDSSATGQSPWYADTDGDGYGVTADVFTACDAPSGYSALDGDCDDSDAAYNPGAAETCSDTMDYNCDGSVGYTDGDGDGYAACEECNDKNANVNPMTAERCNGFDDNCDGLVDDSSAVNPSEFYSDADQDGYGDSSNTVSGCNAPSGYVQTSGDCDDSNAAFNPAATESCDDPNDYNCDGSVAYADADTDGVAACNDCDDRDPSALPGGTEVCDGVDNDCNTEVDDNIADMPTWYADSDADGYGDAETTESACDAPTGFVSDNTDCADDAATVNPGVSEDCATDLDDNCDGDINENCDSADVPDKEKPCGCSEAPAGSAGLLLVAVAGVLGRRRQH